MFVEWNSISSRSPTSTDLMFENEEKKIQCLILAGEENFREMEKLSNSLCSRPKSSCEFSWCWWEIKTHKNSSWGDDESNSKS